MIVDQIISKHQVYDLVALSYTVARLARLAQFKQAERLFKFYEEEINLYSSIRNPHNICQIMLAKATMGKYEENHWSSLIDQLERSNYTNDRNCKDSTFINSLSLAYELIKLEAKDQHDSLFKFSTIPKFLENNKGKDLIDFEQFTQKFYYC